MSKLPWLIVGVVVVAVGVALLQVPIAVATALFGGLVQSATTDRDTYYRLKVSLAYKGEPQDFDIVVGCNVRLTNYAYGGNSYEVGLVPSVFGRRMSDGKGLVVRPPNACRGETTANRRVQPDLMPVVVVYDDADRLDFGRAYFSEDAYEGLLSVLKFGGATIEAATRADFDRFRKTQTNLVTREAYHSALSAPDVLRRLHLRQVPGFAHVCEGYLRYQASDDLRALLRLHWPASRPHYWAASYDVEHALHQTIYQTERRGWAFADSVADRGLPTRTGGGEVAPAAWHGVRHGQPSYPAASDYRLDKWPADKAEWARHIRSADRIADMHIDYRGGETRGFAYCFARAFPGPELQVDLAPKRLLGRIDGLDVTTERAAGGPYVAPLWLMERDEAVFHFFRFYLESTRGDV